MITNEVTAFWTVIVQVGAVIGVIVALIKGIQYLFEMSPTAELQRKVKKIEEHDQKDLEHFKELEVRIDALEKKITDTDSKIGLVDEGVQKLVESQIKLLHHLATGNGQKEMLDESEKLSTYFASRRSK